MDAILTAVPWSGLGWGGLIFASISTTRTERVIDKVAEALDRRHVPEEAQ